MLVYIATNPNLIADLIHHGNEGMDCMAVNEIPNSDGLVEQSAPTAESEKSIHEAEQIIAQGGTGRFKNAQEMFDDLGI